MAQRTYWLDLFTGRSWDEFKKAGGKVSGFRESRRRAVSSMREGDYLLCYLTGVSRFIGVLEVTGKAFEDKSRIWEDDAFPCRIHVKPVLELTAETAVPIQAMRKDLSIFQNLSHPNAWTGNLRGSPSRWKAEDGEAVVARLREALLHPVSRPVDKRQWLRKPRALQTKDLGPVIIPEDEPEAPTKAEPEAAQTEHTRMQALLLRLGADMGFEVWVARNDRSRSWNGKKLSEMPRTRQSLPLQFDDATMRTIELIDVLWLQEQAIVAAFEIEHTTSVYSGLLRMSDLLAMQPNITVPLYIVAPEARTDKVMQEVNRPTFRRLKPPLSDVCRFMSFSSLEARLKDVAAFVRHLKPEFLQEISESCEVGEE